MKTLDELQRVIEYSFREREWLLRAVTHSSFAHENKPSVLDNERLEFLGDSILGFLISEALFRRRPSLDEGQLSKLKAFLVSSANLRRYAERVCLGEFLRLGKGEEKSGGRSKQALLVDAFEALIAAVYLDGGVTPVRGLVRRLFERQIEDVAAAADRISDFKSALQERLHARGSNAAQYRLLDTQGPDHQKLFTVEVRIEGHASARGTGLTKKAAEQAAARRAIESLEDRPTGRPSEPIKPLAGGWTEEL